VSLYHLQKFLYHLNREDRVKAAYHEDLPALLKDYDLSAEEHSAITTGDIGLLYVLGVNGQILMHYAALLNIEWFDYLELMRAGIKKYGPVREGVYAMTGDGESFTAEGRS
jgi:hypothetical protein